MRLASCDHLFASYIIYSLSSELQLTSVFPLTSLLSLFGQRIQSMLHKTGIQSSISSSTCAKMWEDLVQRDFRWLSLHFHQRNNTSHTLSPCLHVCESDSLHLLMTLLVTQSNKNSNKETQKAHKCTCVQLFFSLPRVMRQLSGTTNMIRRKEKIYSRFVKGFFFSVVKVVRSSGEEMMEWKDGMMWSRMMRRHELEEWFRRDLKAFLLWDFFAWHFLVKITK